MMPMRGEERHQRVPERMAVDDQPLAHALGAGGADVVLLQHLQHVGAGEPRDIGDRRHRQHDDRKDRLRKAAPAGDRHHIEADGEEIDEEGGEREVGDGDAGDEHQDDAGVGEAVAVKRRRGAQHDADRDGEEQGGERQDRRDGERGPDHVDDRDAREAERHAEAAVGDVAEIAEELQRGAAGRGRNRRAAATSSTGIAGVVAEQRGDRVARHELRGDEGEDDRRGSSTGKSPIKRRVA